MPDIMIARRPGTVYLNGQRRMVRKGRTTAHADHPIVTEHPKLWEPITVDYPSPDAGGVANGGDSGPVDVSAPAATAVTTPAATPDATPEATTDATPAPADVRAWAASVGIEVSPRGKLPAAVIEQYRQHHEHDPAEVHDVAH